MNEQNGLPSDEQTRLNREETGEAETRAEEQGDVAEPDAPTASEENVGMSTVLDADPLSGVQDDASDQ
jgi:hypothetical protein